MGMRSRIDRLPATLVLAAGLIMTAVGPAKAASQGIVGATSAAASDLSVSVPTLARVSGLDDFNLGTWSGIGPEWAFDPLCVWTTTGGYSVTATGDGAGGAFEIAKGADTIGYIVAWADAPSFAGLNLVTAGNALTGQTTNAATADCNGGASLTATLLVAIFAADLAAAPAGAYTGTLTLVVAPE